MERYDYRHAVAEDVRSYIFDNYDIEDIKARYEADELMLFDDLDSAMWVADEVTGNGSGSYTFSTWQAEENLCHNWELIEDVANEFGYEPVVKSGYEFGAEWWDVSIRCYLLAEAIANVLEEVAG